MNPKVDVVVLTINNISDTKEFVHHLYDSSSSDIFNLIVVDQGSRDGTRDFLIKLAQSKNNVTIKLSENNLGFAGGCNLGASLGTSPFILFINNDALLTRCAMERMIEAMNLGGYDAVGPISNETGEIQRLWADYDRSNYVTEMKRCNEELWKQFKYGVAEFHRLAGFCVLVKRDAFESINGFSLDYGVGYYEDDDLSYRLRRKGYKLGIACGVFVHHHGSRSFKKAKISSNTLMTRNRFLFLGNTYFRADTNESEEVPVSIVICTHNRPQLLKRAVDSVLAQTYSKFELIIVRDGGVDIVDVVNEYDDSRIKYISLDENQGKSAALNIALDTARGDYVAYLDDDDFYLPNHIATLVNALAQTKLDFAYSDSEERVITKDGNVLSRFYSDNEFNIQRLEVTNFIPNLAVMHKNERKYRYDEDLTVLEDWDFLRRAAVQQGAEFVHVPVLTNVFHVRADGKSRNGIKSTNPKLYMSTYRGLIRDGIWWLDSPTSSEALRYRSWDVLNPNYRIECLKESLKKNPWNVLSQVDLADLYIKNYDYKLAMDVLQRSVVGNPECYQKISLLIDLYIAEEKYKDVRELCEIALLFAPTSQEIQRNYEKLSRAYAGYNDYTSLLCYYKYDCLRSMLPDNVGTWGVIKILTSKAKDKYRREGLQGIVAALRRRIYL